MIESELVVRALVEGDGELQIGKDARNLYGVLKKFCIFFWVLVTWVHMYVKSP